MRIKQFSFGLLLAVFLLSFGATAQLKNYKKGVALFDKGYYDLAINELKDVKEIDPAYEAELNFKIAEAYRLSNRHEEALPYYEKLLNETSTYPEVYFHYAYALKSTEQYQKALKAYKTYVSQNSDNKVLNEWANREINTLQIIDILKEKDEDIFFKNLKEVNTEGSEFAPVILNGKIIFTSSRKNKIYSNGLPYLGIYEAPISAEGQITGDISEFSNAIFDPERNEGSPAFSPDGKIVVFARGNSGKAKDVSPNVDLYISRNVPGEGWTEPQLVSASDSLAWDGSPVFSGDGKTIYFASDRPGGSGGLDIYRVNMDGSGRFGTAINMGKTLNTPGNEAFPYVSSEGKLYFASDGHPGLGRLDLFEAVRKNGKISVENMGLPYNSPMDDFGLTFDANGNKYFASNRRGGVGDDDIYFYQAPAVPVDEPVLTDTNSKDGDEDLKVVNYFLEGKITDVETKEPLIGTTVRVYNITSQSDTPVAEFTADGLGGYGPFVLEEDTEYLLYIENKEYLTKRENFSMFGRSIPQILLRKPVTDTTFVLDITLDKVIVGKTFVLENIYYDLDKADIRPDAAKELDKLVEILVDNPNLRIELGSHTDVRGSDMYNLRLSQRRADSAIEYIISKGIERDRLQAQGYGETELIIEDATNEAEHQKNRRTEFKILESTTP